MATAATLPYPNPTSATQYATDLDAAIDISLGKPVKVSPNDVAVTTAWVEAESPDFPGFNGLGTKLKLPGSVNDPSNSQGVQDYPTLDEGLAAAVDMFEGRSPQTTADASAFVNDIASNSASKSKLIKDIYNSDWSGFSLPDTYDATTIAAKLGLKAPSGPKKGSSGAPASSSPPLWETIANTASGGIFDLGATGGAIAKGTVSNAVSGIAGTVGNYILKGVLTLIGGGLIFYGATLLTGRSGGRSLAPAATLGGGAAGAGTEEFAPFGPEDFAAVAA